MTALAAFPQQRNSSKRCAETGESVRVVIADRDGLARCMMHNTLRDSDQVEIAISAVDGREALGLARRYRPTVLILDTTLCPDGCVQLIRELRQAAPHTRVLTISCDDDQTALAALRAGAVGHIDKDVDPLELERLVVRAAEGEAIVPQRLLMPLLERLQEVPDAGWRPVKSRLTTREWEIVELLEEQASTDDIAEQLVLCPTTVYSHIKSILRKLGVHCRREAVAAAAGLRQAEALGKELPNDPA